MVLATVEPPPTPPAVVRVFTVADPIAPTPARAAPPTTPFTKRRRPDSDGYLSDALILAPEVGSVKRVTNPPPRRESAPSLAESGVPNEAVTERVSAAGVEQERS
jgi:hypothetical protein